MSGKPQRPRSPSTWSLAERRAASDYALALAGPSYVLPKLALALVFVFLPLALGITTLSLVHSGLYPAPHVSRDVSNYISRAIPFLLLTALLEIVLAWWSGHAAYFRLNDSLSSLMAGSVERCFLAFVRGAFFSVPYTFINEHWSLTGLRASDLGWPHWLAAFLGVELCYYWMHRMGHEWNLLWAGHNVHHSSDEYNLLTALRQSVWFGVAPFFFVLPLALFLPMPLVYTHREINTLYQFWIHTRLIGKLPAPIEYVFNTPSHHRVHHGRNPQYIDKNYGGTLIIFDRLFGTFEEEKDAVEYGLTHMPSTWNPITTQTHHFEEMWRAAKVTPGFWRKLRVFLDLGPGYNFFLLNYDPALKAVRAPPPPPKRLMTVPNTPMRAYVIAQFLATTVQTLLFLETVRLSPKTERHHWLFLASILVNQLSLGALFDQLASAPLLALTANVLTWLSALYFIGHLNTALWGLAAFELCASLWVLHWQR